MNPAFLIHMATAYSKAMAKGHEANSISYLVLEIKRNLSVVCLVYYTVDLPQPFGSRPFSVS